VRALPCPAFPLRFLHLLFPLPCVPPAEQPPARVPARPGPAQRGASPCAACRLALPAPPSAAPPSYTAATVPSALHLLPPQALAAHEQNCRRPSPRATRCRRPPPCTSWPCPAPPLHALAPSRTAMNGSATQEQNRPAGAASPAKFNHHDASPG
jgi:hypothetical protein